MSDVIDRLRAAAEAQAKATPGPWNTSNLDNWRQPVLAPGMLNHDNRSQPREIAQQVEPRDAHFIAAARSLPLAALARLVEAVMAWQGVVDNTPVEDGIALYFELEDAFAALKGEDNA